MTAVKEVLECIKHMNAESEISTKFSGSFNGTSFGNFVSGKMSPTAESLMIEKYWEQRYP